MTAAYLSAALGVGGQVRRVLVQPGSIRAPFTLNRAQVGAQATAIAANGTSVEIFGQGTARFTGTARRLLIEGQRDNAIAAPNNFGTGWTAISSGAGSSPPVLTPNVATIAAPDGSFTATRMQAEAGTSGWSGLTRPVATNSVRSVWIRTVIGTARLQIATSGTMVAEQADVTTTWQRIWRSNVDGAHRILALSSVSGNSQSVDVLLWGASSETASLFPSSLVLPPTGTSQTTMRGPDQASAMLSSLGIGAGGGCTILWSGVIPFIGTSGAHQTIIQVDDGTNANCFRLRCLPGGSVAAGHVLSGTTVDAVSPGNALAGTLFRAGLTIAGGRIAASVDGGLARVATGGPATGLTTLRLGVDAVLGASMFGETASLTVLPFALTDARLSAAVAATPG